MAVRSIRWFRGHEGGQGRPAARPIDRGSETLDMSLPLRVHLRAPDIRLALAARAIEAE